MKSLGEAILNRCHESSGKTAFMYKEPARWKEVTWNEVFQRISGITGGLETRGVQRGQSVALLSNTRLEWALTDYAIQSFGAVTVPVYQSSVPQEISFILNNCDAVGIFVEDRGQLEKIRAIRKECPKLRWAAVFDGSVTEKNEDGLDIFGLSVFESKKQLKFEELKKKIEGINQEDLATIIYTSGTTGVPKGVCLEHRCIISVASDASVVGVGENDVSLAFLPMAHVFGRVELYMPVFWAGQICFAQNLQTIVDDFAVAKPTVLWSVPRIYEKVYAKILSGVEASGPTKKKIFDWALTIGFAYSKCIERGESVPLGLALQYRVAKRLVFSKITKKFGGRIRLAVSGGAPLSETIARFFHACGILILEGYGLTETTGPFTCNLRDHFRFGTVGAPLGDSQIKFDTDGEILLKGSRVFSRFNKNEEATAREFTSDGWYRSGDIGEFTDGFLRITDRKKDLIVTAGGKKIAPQYVENLLKLEPGISQAVAVGDRQKYIAALITVDRGEIENYARQHGIDVQQWSELVKHPKVYSYIDESISRVNEKLPHFSTVKKFRILENDFSVETGELTPSMKIKRKVCAEKYKSEIASLYS